MRPSSSEAHLAGPKCHRKQVRQTPLGGQRATSKVSGTDGTVSDADLSSFQHGMRRLGDQQLKTLRIT